MRSVRRSAIGCRRSPPGDRIKPLVFGPLVFGLLAIGALGANAAFAGDPPERLTIATWNLEWFYDDQTGDNYQDVAREQSAPNREAWIWKRDAVAAAIAKLSPDIIALQEIENQQVLYYLTQQLKKEHQQTYRIGFVQGSDFFTEQDVAVLYRTGLVQLGRWEGSEEDRADRSLAAVPKHLLARFRWGVGDATQRLTLINLHLRATPEQVETRQRQARQLCRWIQTLEPADREQLLVLGDLNTESLAERPDDESEVSVFRTVGTDDQADDLFDLHALLAADRRPTHLSGRQFDRILATPGLRPEGPHPESRTPNAVGPRAGRRYVVTSVETARELVVRGEPDVGVYPQSIYTVPEAERDISDHYPVVARLELR